MLVVSGAGLIRIPCALGIAVLFRTHCAASSSLYWRVMDGTCGADGEFSEQDIRIMSETMPMKQDTISACFIPLSLILVPLTHWTTRLSATI